ncbi:MAG: polysaccharide deacetylase family protein [Gammaproteobacteria bacterium]
MIVTASRLALDAAALLQRRLSIVLFHHVLPAPDPLLPDEPDIARFDEQVGWLARTFEILPAGEALALLYAGKLPRRALSITFDDGYRDNLEHALPVLQRHGVRATFFVTTRHLDGGMMWNDRVIAAVRAWPEDTLDLREHGLGEVALEGDRCRALHALLPRIKYLPAAEREALSLALLAASGAADTRLMMNAEEIRALHAAGMEIGGHTDGHPILAGLADAGARDEIVRNKDTLERILDAPLDIFAYPNGTPGRDYDTRHVAMLRECGYRYALTTAAGTANTLTDPLQVPRFTPWDRERARYLARMTMNYFRPAEYAPEAPAVTVDAAD